jgi:hypothetical protein
VVLFQTARSTCTVDRLLLFIQYLQHRLDFLIVVPIRRIRRVLVFVEHFDRMIIRRRRDCRRCIVLHHRAIRHPQLIG